MFFRISLLLAFIVVACANPPPTPTPMLTTVAPTPTATYAPTPTPTANPPTATPTSTPTATPIPPTPTATPSPTPTPLPTATPRPTPTPVPQPTLRPQQLYQLDYAVGYGSWEKCGDTVSYRQAVALGFGQGYTAGSLAAEAEFCPPAPTPTPTPTATPRPVQFITAPREVWDCFLARDDSVKDKYDVVLSPCGWTETVLSHVDFDLPESTRNSPVASSFIPKGWDRELHVEYIGSDRQRRVQAELLDESLEELSELLRIDLDIMDAEAATDDSTLHVRFLYVETLECSERVERFWGCAEWWDSPNVIRIAVRNKSEAQLLGIITHELLHVLAYVAHAEQGVMSDGRTYKLGLSDMDRAQLWLFSNPLFRGWQDVGKATTLEEARRMVRYGEWEEPPPL